MIDADATTGTWKGKSNYVRVQVLTNAGALDRDKQHSLNAESWMHGGVR
jgi:hypothetical protein